jgi:hypothetical protein
MESPEVGRLRWLEDDPAGGPGRFDDSDDLFLAVYDLGERERRRTGRWGHPLTDVSFEGIGPEEAEE